MSMHSDLSSHNEHLCNSCGHRSLSFYDSTIVSSTVIETALLSRIPDKVEIEMALEKTGWIAKCMECSNVTTVNSNSMGPRKISKSVGLLCSMMESAVSSVSVAFWPPVESTAAD